VISYKNEAGRNVKDRNLLFHGELEDTRPTARSTRKNG
jgi:hypothetical protein